MQGSVLKPRDLVCLGQRRRGQIWAQETEGKRHRGQVWRAEGPTGMEATVQGGDRQCRRSESESGVAQP